jgi:hypothetical protein
MESQDGKVAELKGQGVLKGERQIDIAIVVWVPGCICFEGSTVLQYRRT